FSSRRRHTRFSRDWSSDVCSSDLENFEEQPRNSIFSSVVGPSIIYKRDVPSLKAEIVFFVCKKFDFEKGFRSPIMEKEERPHLQIGRASCRERVKITLVTVLLKTI